jgi:dihydrofolate reductase
MLVRLYNAISLDGFIGTSTGDVSWVSEVDVPYFNAEMQKAGCIVIGRKTFEQFEGNIFPVKGVLNIVMTTAPVTTAKYDNILFTNESPAAVVKLAETRGYKELLLVGGSKLNGSFLKAGLIDEIALDIHPLILGSGIKLFSEVDALQQFNRVSVQELEQGQLLVRYLKTKD